MKRRVLLYITAGMFLCIVAAAAWMYYKPHPKVETAAPAFNVSAAELIEAFTNDEANANVLYGGKIVQVRGNVKEIFSGDGAVVLQLGDAEEMASVSCYLQKERPNHYTFLKRGQPVTVKGICNGILLDVVLDKCVLLTNE